MDIILLRIVKVPLHCRDLKYRGGYYYAMYGADIVARFRPKYRAAAPANPLFARREPSFAEFVDYLLETPVERYDEHWRLELQTNLREI